MSKVARAKNGHSVTTSTRLPFNDRAVVDVLAQLEGVTVSVLLREMVVPAARQRLAELAAGE